MGAPEALLISVAEGSVESSPSIKQLLSVEVVVIGGLNNSRTDRRRFEFARRVRCVATLDPKLLSTTSTDEEYAVENDESRTATDSPLTDTQPACNVSCV